MVLEVLQKIDWGGLTGEGLQLHCYGDGPILDFRVVQPLWGDLSLFKHSLTLALSVSEINSLISLALGVGRTAPLLSPILCLGGEKGCL